MPPKPERRVQGSPRQCFTMLQQTAGAGVVAAAEEERQPARLDCGGGMDQVSQHMHAIRQSESR